LAAHSGKKNIIAGHSGKNHDWQHILGKTRLAPHSGKNMIGSTFWKKYIIDSKLFGKT
jgi:hypothetical protein